MITKRRRKGLSAYLPAGWKPPTRWWTIPVDDGLPLSQIPDEITDDEIEAISAEIGASGARRPPSE